MDGGAADAPRPLPSCDCCVELLLQDKARDSSENLLFGLCRFYELTGHYPEFVVVVGYEFKRQRFEQLHRSALRLPAEAFRYEGTQYALSAVAEQARTSGGEGRGQDALCFFSRRLLSTTAAAAMPLQGEQATLAAFTADPYGCSAALQAKRQQRDPFGTGGYDPTRCPAMAELLSYCGPRVYDGALPWDGTA